MSEEKRHGEELFSAMARAGSRTYFFDVLKAENGARYIKISESRRSKSEERHRRHRVMVFEEHLGGFIDAFHEACLQVPDQPRERRVVPNPETTSARRNGPKPKWSATRLAEMRTEHPLAYEKWTEDDDARLRAEFAKGTDKVALAAMFRRQPSAIDSRIRKLGLR